MFDIYKQINVSKREILDFQEYKNEFSIKIVFLNKLNKMRSREIKIEFKEFESIEELSSQDQSLILAAREAADKAYAPYSRFNVGAAVLLDNNEVILGNNQENADFTDGLCAERVALFYAHAKYPGVAANTIAVTAKNSKGVIIESAQPCGSCRQVMVETEFRFRKPIRILLDGKDGIQLLEGADNLLPLAFKPASLDS